MTLIYYTTKCLPKHKYTQGEIIDAVSTIFSPKTDQEKRLIKRFFENTKVGSRHLAIPLEDFAKLKGFQDRNDAFIRVATELASKVVDDLIRESGVDRSSIGLIASTTITGIATPSLEARVLNRVELRRDIKRIPIFGLGCLGGVAGINRVCDYLKGNPTEAAIFFSVELCSLTIQKDDLSVANMVSSGLFGDGAAAVLLVGEQHPLAKKAKFKHIDSQSAFFPNTERVMGWDMVDSGFRIVLSPNVPDMVLNELPRELAQLKNNHPNKKIEFFIAHPGGPKVIEAMQTVTGGTRDDFRRSWDGLEKYGNMSSASVLFNLHENMQQMPKGRYGLMMAMGPAFCSEMTLLENMEVHK